MIVYLMMVVFNFCLTIDYVKVLDHLLIIVFNDDCFVFRLIINELLLNWKELKISSTHMLLSNFSKISWKFLSNFDRKFYHKR